MEHTSHKAKTVITAILLIVVLAGAIYAGMHIPPQNLKITAQTQAKEFDMSGTADIYYLKPLSASGSYTAAIKFMAVENTSGKLFTSHGTGQYVELGCDDLVAECGFISFGRFLHIRLTLNAAQTELKLEDGTPFDITRYSLRPVLAIEER